MKLMCYTKTTVLALLFSGLLYTATAQSLPIEIDMDYATFAYNEEASLLELYFAFGASSLTFETDSSNVFFSNLPIQINVQHSSVGTALLNEPQKPVWTDSVHLKFAVADTQSIQAGQHFVHLFRAALPPGEYEMAVKIPKDTTQGRAELVLQRDMLIPDYTATDQARLSDITLATAVNRSDQREDLFFKNGLLVRPNPNALFGAGLPKLFYYAEVYHLQAGLSDDSYHLYTYISDANRPQPWPGLEKRMERPVRDPDVLVGSFDLSAVPSGSYILKLILLNANNVAIVEQNQKFFVYNPSVAIATQANPLIDDEYETSLYAGMTEEEVVEALAHIDVIARDTERQQVKKLSDLDGKRQFLMQFWRKRDSNPSTPVNEYKQDFYSRVQYTKERYSSRFSEGWKTDRGRVVLKYGLPTTVDPHHYARDSAPYEVWEYNNIPGEGQSQFIFADMSGFNEYELLHSTVAGERKTADWQRAIRQRRR